MPQTYLDNSATTRVCGAAADAAYKLMTEVFGNPSSLHSMGFRAEQELTAARKAVAGLIGAQPEQITFTSGGTEANNLAVFGSVAAHPHDGRHIVTTAVILCLHCLLDSSCSSFCKNLHNPRMLVSLCIFR